MRQLGKFLLKMVLFLLQGDLGIPHEVFDHSLLVEDPSVDL